jgi:transcription initiation factor TFIIIB Brf1 subunit/transcription initiation factor TFIIB
MKIEKLLHRLQALFDTEKHKKRQHIGELKKVLLKLKKKERKITLALQQTDEDCLIKHYQTELEIIRVQRKKGIEVLQQLKERKRAPTSLAAVLTKKHSETSED